MAAVVGGICSVGVAVGFDQVTHVIVQRVNRSGHVTRCCGRVGVVFMASLLATGVIHSCTCPGECVIKRQRV